MKLTGQLSLDLTAGAMPGQISAAQRFTSEDGTTMDLASIAVITAGESISFGPVTLEFAPMASSFHGKTEAKPTAAGAAAKGAKPGSPATVPTAAGKPK